MSDLRAAKSLFRQFREAEPDRIKKVAIDIPRAAAVMGHVEFIGYVTTHGKRATLYIHEFAPGSRPLLAAGKRRGQLFIVAGRFKVTHRGITDLDHTGRAIDARPRYKVTRRT